MATVKLNMTDLMYIEKFVEKAKKMKVLSLEHSMNTDVSYIRGEFEKKVWVQGATPNAQRYMNQQIERWANRMAKQNREEAKEAWRKDPPEDEHKNRNYYKLPERTEFFGRRRDHYDFAGDDSAIIASKNNGIAGRGDNQSKIYWNPNAVASNGKKGAYFYQKPLISVEYKTIVDDEKTIANINEQEEKKAIELHFIGADIEYVDENSKVILRNIGKEYIDKKTTKEYGKPILVADYEEIEQKDTPEGNRVFVEEQLLRQYYVSEIKTYSIKISLITSFKRKLYLEYLKMTAEEMLQERCEIVVRDIVFGGFPENNIHSEAFQFGLDNNHRHGNVSRIELIEKTTTLNEYKNIRNQRITTWTW